jgi:hypothetical protein
VSDTDPRPGLFHAEDDSEGRPTEFKLSDDGEWTDEEFDLFHELNGSLFDDPESFDE